MSHDRLIPILPDGQGNGQPGIGGNRRARGLATAARGAGIGGGLGAVVLLASCATQEGTTTATHTPAAESTATTVPDGCSIPVNHVDTCVVDSETLKVPMIDGVTARAVVGKIEFFASDTRYGVEAGTYVGQYVPGVSENGEKTGALGYTQPVIEKLMAGLPANTIVLNSDLSGLGNVDISVDPDSAAAAGAGLITIDTHGRSVAMYDMVPGTRQYIVSSTVWGGDNEGLLSRALLISNNSKLTPEDYISMDGPYGLPHTTQQNGNYQTLSFGQSLGMSHGEPTHISYGVHHGDGANIQNQILNVNGTPVFITAPAA